MKIEEILLEAESTTLEFKENLNSADKIISTIIAFANTSGGRVIIGINDKTHSVTGVKDPHKISEAFSSKIYDSIEPRILPNIEIIPYRNVHLISIEVFPSALRPHFTKSKGKEKSTYIRIGSTTRLADHALLNAIERSTVPKSFDEELCYEASYEDINFTAASQLFEFHRKLQLSDLVSLRIVEKNGKELIPTIAGILLFGINRLHIFPDAWIQVGAFEGTDKEKILDTQKITSMFPQAIDDALNFLKKNMKIALKIEDTKHQEVWEIPKIALREAVINAIVHTDYSLKGSPIKIAVFDDRIEIENSALLPWGLTFDDLKSGVSKLRNPVIARVFNEIGLIEQWGSGIKRMTKSCIEAGLKEPEFKEIGPRIRVIFYREKVGQVIVDEIDQSMLDLLSMCDSLSTHQITMCVNLSRRSVINRLTELMDKGQITEISQSPNDPKKKYTLTRQYTLDERRKKMQDVIVNSGWNINTNGPYAFIIMKAGNNYINFIFSDALIADHFLDYDKNNIRIINENSSSRDNEALKKIKQWVVSDPIFGTILSKALTDEKVQEAFKEKETPQYPVLSGYFGHKDYR